MEQVTLDTALYKSCLGLKVPPEKEGKRLLKKQLEDTTTKPKHESFLTDNHMQDGNALTSSVLWSVVLLTLFKLKVFIFILIVTLHHKQKEYFILINDQ
uniref:Uncharacterized protein n=1 Tax=Denticeps clupeoides TaxID=299321 RepID=A0AAY4D1X5_9TELE